MAKVVCRPLVLMIVPCRFFSQMQYVGNIEGQEAMVKTLYVADGHASGRQEDWIIHEIFEFTSDRKRQSVIAESPEGCKRL